MIARAKFGQEFQGCSMGKWILIICLISLCYAGTGCTDSTVKKSGEPIVELGGTSVNDKNNIPQLDECEQFLRDYEAWVKVYINLIQRYQKNPQDKTIIEDYEKMLAEIGKWDIRSRQCIKDSAVFIEYEKLQEQLNTYAIKVALTK